MQEHADPYPYFREKKKNKNAGGIFHIYWYCQEPITRSLHLPYKPYESTFARIFLFLETAGLLDSRAVYAVYAIQYNIIQRSTTQLNTT